MLRFRNFMRYTHLMKTRAHHSIFGYLKNSIKKQSQLVPWFGLGSTSICLLASGGIWLWHRNTQTGLLFNVLTPVLAASNKGVDSALYGVADIVEKVSPAVVYISAVIRSHFVSGSSAGTGFFVSPNGYVLTNKHVVVDNSDVTVKLSDGTTYTGRVLVVDKLSDLALIKIDPVKGQKFPYIPLGDISKLRVGEFIVQIGSPLNLANTVTIGVVSNKERDFGRGFKYIQSDACTNVGSSGGPLVNMQGEAVGVTVAKLSEPGFSFSIPCDQARRFLDLAIRHVSTAPAATIAQASFQEQKSSAMGSQRQKRFIGITMLSLTPQLLQDLAEYNPAYSKLETGVLIHNVQQGSPAHKAGIIPGDVVIRANDNEVQRAADIYKVVSECNEIELTIYRNGMKFSVKVGIEVVS